MATKKGPAVPPLTVEQIRAVIDREAVDLSTFAGPSGPSMGSLHVWAKGAVPSGAPPFPDPVKAPGRVRLYCRTEVEAWIAEHYTRRT